MTIQTPFHIGYVQCVADAVHTLDKITVYAYKESINIEYYTINPSTSVLTEIYPLVQLTKEGYDKIIQREKLEKTSQFQNIIDVFNEVFNPEDWDYTITNEATVEFIIKFDSFVISNIQGEEHTIKDLFVRLVYNIPLQRFDALHGIRKTLTYSEFSSDYGHSHLNGATQWSRFCLGDGEISNFWSYIQINNSSDIEKNLRGFLYSLYPYLLWENLEATPWRYIQRIKQSNRILTDNTFSLSIDIIKQILSTADIADTLILDENNFEITLNQGVQFLSQISKNAPEIYKCYYDDYLSAFYGLSSVNTRNISNVIDSCPIVFKDQKITLNVISDALDSVQLETYNRFLSPKNVDIISNYIKDNFKKTLVQNL